MSAVHNLLRVAQHASSGIVALDATGLKEEGCNSLSGYPPTSTTAPDTSYYNEDSTIQKGPETLAEPSVTVNVSLLQGAAMETPASLDLATQRTTEGNKRHHHHRYHDQRYYGKCASSMPNAPPVHQPLPLNRSSVKGGNLIHQTTACTICCSTSI